MQESLYLGAVGADSEESLKLLPRRGQVLATNGVFQSTPWHADPDADPRIWDQVRLHEQATDLFSMCRSRRSRVLLFLDEYGKTLR